MTLLMLILLLLGYCIVANEQEERVRVTTKAKLECEYLINSFSILIVAEDPILFRKS